MLDEARLSGRVTFAAPDEDYFHDADGGLDLTLDEIQGRNTWMVWSAGNDRLWDWLARESAGAFDLLKIVGSYDPEKDPAATPGQREKLKQLYGFRRENRMARLGLINEPCFEQAKDGDARRYGLWLDQRQLACAPDPFENGEKYLGVPAGARGQTVLVGSVYGSPSGVLGLRLFPNPDFRDAAETRWDPVRYYTDAALRFEGPGAAVPVGMTCAFCHAGWNPAKLPGDREDPLWENVSSTAGAQYLRVDRVALWQGDASQFSAAAFARMAAGVGGPVADGDGSHRQSAGDRRHFADGGSHADGAAVGQGEAGGSVARKPSDEHIRGRRTAGHVFRGAGDGVDAAHGEGRDGFGGHTGRGESPVRRVGDVQRRVAAACQPAGGRQGAIADGYNAGAAGRTNQ
jgi:hypothetical protein